MALVTTRKTEEKYSHLKKLYSESEPKVSKKKEKKKIEFKKDKVEVSRRELVKFALVFSALALLSASGYLIGRFV